MNVCFVLISDGWGGAENVVRQIISCLVKRGVTVSLIINHEINGYFKEMDVQLLDLGSLFDFKSVSRMILKPDASLKTENSRPVKVLNILLMFIYFYRARNRINRFLDANRVEVIHSHLEYSDILSSIIYRGNKEKKWMNTIHGPWFSLYYTESRISSLSNWFFTGLLRRISRKMDAVTFVSQYLYDESRDIFGESELDKKGVVIPNGIDISQNSVVSRISGSKIPDSTGNGETLPEKVHTYTVDNKKFNILFPGGPKLKKGGDILIEALKTIVNDIPDLNLYIALEVPENHLIRKLVDEYSLQDHVQFVGFLDPDNYMALLNSVDMLAMPSRMEPFGMVYLEAMAFGIPVVASNIGGATEIIENNRNGILTPPKPDEVARAILMLYKDKSLREEISKNNLRDIHKFKWDTIVDRYVKTYNNLVNHE
jgi:glycosyltransferase involved in cell wall biosynthesis